MTRTDVRRIIAVALAVFYVLVALACLVIAWIAWVNR